MDIYAFLSRQGGVYGPIMTRLYDERLEPAFVSRIQAISMQHMGTCLSVSCKWNISDSQFVRYTCIVSDLDGFISAVAHLLQRLLHLRYPMEILWSRLSRRVRTTSLLFGVARGNPYDRRLVSQAAADMRGLLPAILRRAGM